jgi:hypothetical protein
LLHPVLRTIFSKGIISLAAPALVALAVAASQRARLHTRAAYRGAGHAAAESASCVGGIRTLDPAGLTICAAEAARAAYVCPGGWTALAIALDRAAGAFPFAAVASLALTVFVGSTAELLHTLIVELGRSRTLVKTRCALGSGNWILVYAYHDHVAKEELIGRLLWNIARAVSSVVTVAR